MTLTSPDIYYLELHCEQEKVWARNTCDNVRLTPLTSQLRIRRKARDSTGNTKMGQFYWERNTILTICTVTVSSRLLPLQPLQFHHLHHSLLLHHPRRMNHFDHQRCPQRSWCPEIFCNNEISNINIVGNLGEKVREKN